MHPPYRITGPVVQKIHQPGSASKESSWHMHECCSGSDLTFILEEIIRIRGRDLYVGPIQLDQTAVDQLRNCHAGKVYESCGRPRPVRWHCNAIGRQNPFSNGYLHTKSAGSDRGESIRPVVLRTVIGAVLGLSTGSIDKRQRCCRLHVVLATIPTVRESSNIVT